MCNGRGGRTRQIWSVITSNETQPIEDSGNDNQEKQPEKASVCASMCVYVRVYECVCVCVWR